MKRNDPVARFWARVDKSGDCWLWLGCRLKFGYGQVSVNGTVKTAHHYSWILSGGNIPKGKILLHKCDNPPCVRPSHLMVGSRVDNRRDCVEKGRQAKGSRVHATKLKEENVMAIRRQYKFGRGAALAREFGVDKSTVYALLGTKSWAHVPKEATK